MLKEIAELCRGSIRKFSAVVIGDFMLDVYIYGEADRISPEAPVPVIKFSNEKLAAGGAGNVVANLTALGLSVTAFGRVGNDIYGDKLLGCMSPSADTSLIFRRGDTVIKTRILNNRGQQMLRLDREDVTPPLKEEENRVLEALCKAAEPGKSCVIVSDYAKGFCSPLLCSKVIEFGKDNSIPVFIDPKGSDWTKYSGAFAVTPNVRELAAAVGHTLHNTDYDISFFGERIRNKYRISNLLVTRSSEGSTLIGSSGDIIHERGGKVDVYDVSGAGDTMIAYAAAFYTAGVGLSVALSAANIAAQVAIGRVGTYSVSAADMLSVLEGTSLNSKIASAEEAQVVCAAMKKQGKRVVFTNGCFDILHSGHIDSLTKAAELGDFLIVGLNSDSSVKRLKGAGRPVNPFEARAKVLAAMSAVDMVVPFEEDTPRELLSLLRPNIVVKGGDYHPDEVAGREFADEVVIVPITEGFSTTNIIKALEKTDES